MKMVRGSVEDQYEQVKLRSETYSTLANFYNLRPDTTFIQNLKKSRSEIFGWQARTDDIDENVKTGIEKIASFVKALPDANEDEIILELQKDWTRLFRGVKPGYGPPPPYEGVYLHGGQQEIEVIKSINRFYIAFGASPQDQPGHRLDYIGLEFGFLSFLCEQQLEALEKGENHQEIDWEQAEVDFLKKHLGKWVVRFCDEAIKEAKTDFYLGILLLTKGFVDNLLNDY